MKLLLFSLFAITQAFLAKALETDLQFKYADTIIFEQPEKNEEIQILKYKLENVYYIVYDEKYSNSTIYQVGLKEKYIDKYCVNGNTCRVFSKPLRNTGVDSAQLIRLFEYLGSDIIEYLTPAVGHITSGCAFKNAKFIEATSTPESIYIDGLFYTDPKSKMAQAYKDQSILFNGFNEDTPLARFEWIKFISVFYGKEKEASDIFESVAFQYVCNKNLIMGNNLFARLRVAWLTSATLSNENEITSYKDVKDTLTKSHFLVDISSGSSGDYTINDFYDQYRYDVNDNLLLLKEQNILRNDASQTEDGIKVWENDYAAFPHLVLLDLIYWFHPKLFFENDYNANIVKKLYAGISLNDDFPSDTPTDTGLDQTNQTNQTVVTGNSTATDSNNIQNNEKLRKRYHITHSVSSYWFRNIPRDTNIKRIPNNRCPSLLSEYVSNNICLSDASFSGDYDEYAKFDDVMTQVKNYAVIYYPIIGVVVLASLIIGFIFIKIYRKRQLERKGYNDSQKILHDTEGFVEF
ncbi:hypothetical protein LY90DRAFT_501016 [Neocallimastix californiae]|uniref:Periplasmic binding protein-like II n=1 Tax=Neocallimastix californiae TaxID=1754190 RepID=A0A1Y2F4L9_9FUNG|nr:hypothetical protein LY90DRAFT_501016 [Neocallimastix californiae]|eukprot:ORY78819.1 hypothetical protein LY90DRAFT_501016 [Neocallimastix californiae]